MSLPVIIGALVSEAILAGLSFACFAYIYREYRRRQAAGMLSFAVGFLVLGIAFAAWFALESANFSGSVQAAEYSHRLFVTLFILAPFFLIDGFQRSFGGRLVRLRAAGLTVVALAIVSLAAFFVRFSDIDPTAPLLVFHQVWWTDFLVIFSWLALAAVTALAAWHYRRNGGLRRLALAVAGSLAAAIVFAVVCSLLSHPLPALFLLFFAVISVFSLCLLAVAGNHPDPEVAEDPINLIRHSLSLKTAVFQALLFWLLYLAVMVVAVAYFVQLDLQNKEGQVQRMAVRITECVHDSQRQLQDQVRVFALAPRQLPAEYDGSGRLPDQLDDLIEISDSRLVRIVDSEGRIVYSNFSVQEIGQSLADWPAVRLTLSGIPSASLETDPGYGRPVVVAAASVSLDDGTQGALIVSRDIDRCYQPTVFFGIRTDSYGLINRLGEPISAIGPNLSPESFRAMGTTGEYGAVATRRTSSGGLLAFSPVMDSAGQVNGYAYSFLSADTVRASAVGLAAVIVVMAFLALCLMTMAIIAALAVILRPIRALREAAAAVEKGDYSQVVTYDSPDELGKLARTFNQMRQKIKRQTERLEGHIKEQTAFMVNTAHEMRTPLNVFSWTVDLLRFGDIGRLNKDQLDLVEQLRQTTKRLFGLVSNLSDAAKMASGELSVESRPFQVVDVLEEVAGNYAVKMREKEIELDWRQPIGEIPPVRGDSQRTYQVVSNLISNAVKYTEEHGKIKLRLKKTSRRSPSGPKGQYLRVSVEDNGIGIPEEQHDLVFSRFFRARNAVASDIQGAGLGLFLVKKLVELQGGAVWFESAEGAGSVFSFTLPIADGERNNNNDDSGA